MREIDLLENPKIKRKFDSNWRTDKNRVIAKRFDYDFFDGDRANGYGGYYYDGRWKNIVKKLENLYGINKNSSVLDIGCAKGFLIFDLIEKIKGINARGNDISLYARDHAMQGYAKYLIEKEDIYYPEAIMLEDDAKRKIKPLIDIASADQLPYGDNSFDLVLSINTTHNLPKERFKKAIKEMIRVSKNKENMFIQLDSYSNDKQKEAMGYWNLTGLTVMSDAEWFEYLPSLGYRGDFFGTKLQPEES
jgi:ubiquinone/menaquinone biosynthesis C-methylase UbiE